jgi:hypothetical protein
VKPAPGVLPELEMEIEAIVQAAVLATEAMGVAAKMVCNTPPLEFKREHDATARVTLFTSHPVNSIIAAQAL